MGDTKTAREKAIEQKRIKRCSGYVDSDDPRLQHPTYKRAREMWAKFVRGEITSKELDEAFGNFSIETDRQESIKEMFDGEIVS